ncbi:MAG: prolyl oligopeptidase family serine peptidase [Sedimentisphaerales bacterium]|nr:prolyl oligopeptidase family serine peptidase [Sedimentisphaerales bacterium]
MRTNYLVSLVIGGLLLIGCAKTEKSDMKSDKVLPGQQQAQAFEKTITKQLGIDYLLYLPKGYGEKEQEWPLMMFLHGAGERGDDLNKVKVHGPPKLAEGGKDLGFIIVSPQCPRDDWWTEKTEVLINLLDEIEERYDVDASRVYLTGLSMGGYGTWTLGSAYPERFAAIVPICGGGKRFSGWRLKDVPVWAFHGGKDNVVPLSESEDMVKAVKQAGGDAKLTVYPDAGHDSWTATYDDPALYEWLLEHRKGEK